MGKLDIAHGNSALLALNLYWDEKDETVFSRLGFPRYAKRFNSKGRRRHGQFSMRPENRTRRIALRKSQFSSRKHAWEGTSRPFRAD